MKPHSGRGAPPPKGSSCLPAVGTQRLETKEQKRDEGRYKRPNKTINTTTQNVIHKKEMSKKTKYNTNTQTRPKRILNMRDSPLVIRSYKKRPPASGLTEAGLKTNHKQNPPN